MKWAALALVVVATSCGGSGGSGDPSEPGLIGPVAIGEAWAPATVDAATTGAVYVELTAPADDALAGADVDPAVAERVTLHETVTEPSGHDDDGAAMVMMSSVDRVELPGGDTVTLEPGGIHLMLAELAQPLRAGTTFDVTLRFETAPDAVVEVTVRDR